MNNGQLLDFVNFMIRKETEGNLMTMKQANVILPICSKEHFIELFKNYEKVIQSSDAFKRFRPTVTIPLTTGLGTLPTDYWHLSSLVDSTGKEVDFVTDQEWPYRINHSIIPPTTDYPIARFYKTGVNLPQIQVLPNTIPSVIMTYLKYPIEPVIDYYVNVNDEQVYLPQGTTHTWVAGEYDSLGVAKTTGTYTSTSVELDWNEDDKITIAYLVLQKLGINLKDGLYEQYAMAKEAQQNTQV